MLKRAIPAVIAFFGLCLPALAGETTVAAPDFYRTNLFSTVDASVLIHSLPVSSLLNGRHVPISSALGRMGMTPLDFAPLAYLPAVNSSKARAESSYGDDEADPVSLLRSSQVYVSGELGFFYGTSTGRYGGGSDIGGYVIGTVGNDRIQVTAGASYEESSVRYPRRFSR
jgi:hypothetical protein